MDKKDLINRFHLNDDKFVYKDGDLKKVSQKEPEKKSGTGNKANV